MRELGIYIHIPFCVQKCGYCDFLSMKADEEGIRKYVRGVVREIEVFGMGDVDLEGYEVGTVFFGGGTPSFIDEGYIVEILEGVYRRFCVRGDAEITVEANPGTVTKRKARGYWRGGVNRISMGLQSVHDEELGMLGRVHTYEEFLESYRCLREAGFENVNVDLMMGLPGQSYENWLDTLEKVAGIGAEHISAYGLIVEEGTPFYERYTQDVLCQERGGKPFLLPDEETERRMYWGANEVLRGHGYEHYEISNYAKKGFACEHNIGYWVGREYVGFGLGASSYIKGVRSVNTRRMKEYVEISSGAVGQRSCAGLKKDIQILTEQEKMEEFMFLGLRMMDGVSKAEFEQRFGCTIDEIYKEVMQKLKRQGLIKEEKDRLYLTQSGIDISNYVLSEFLLDDII